MNRSVQAGILAALDNKEEDDTSACENDGSDIDEFEDKSAANETGDDLEL